MKFDNNKLPVFILYLIGIAFSIKAIREPDLWWQLATGNYIFQHLTVPSVDIFSFTYQGTPWINIKWGYEVLAAVVAMLTGPEGIMLIQVVITLATIFVLGKWIWLKNQSTLSASGLTILPAMVAMMVLVGNSYRISGRPEMFSHLLSLCFIYLINKYTNQRKLVIIMPVLQLCWTNLHEAFGMGIILLLIYTIAEWYSYFMLNKSGKLTRPLHLSLALLLSVAVIGINPYGWKMYLQPFEIYAQLGANKFTTELVDYSSYLYWSWPAYVTLSLFVIVCLRWLQFVFQFAKGKRLQSFIDSIGLGNLLMVIAFVYLSAGAFRNLVFLNLAIAPFVAEALNAWLSKLFTLIKKINGQSMLWVVTCLVGVIFYTAVVSNSFYRLINSNDRYGLQVTANTNPVGAAKYIMDQKLQHEKLFCDYLSSSYLLHRLSPDYKTFIDLRDLDVFPDTFFYQNAEIYNFYERYKAFDKQYDFKAAIVLNNQFTKLQRGLYHDSAYYLAYLDPLISVYQKGKGPDVSISPFLPATYSGIGYWISKLFNPFYSPETYGGVDYNTEYIKLLSMLGDEDKAIEKLRMGNKSITGMNETELNLLGNYYTNHANLDTALKASFLDSAKVCFETCLRLNKENIEANFSLGLMYLQKGHFKKAVEYFEQSCEYGDHFLNGHLYAAETYKLMNDAGQGGKYLKPLLHHLKICNKLLPNNPNVVWNLGIAYYKSGNCEDAVPLLEQSLLFKELSADDIYQAKQCITNCR